MPVPAPAPVLAPSVPESNFTPPSDAPPVPSKPQDEQPKSALEGAGPAVSAPKPVEVTSVPETPVNGGTPAGGTPRPELKISEEPQKETPTPKEAPVILGPRDLAAGPKEASPPEPITDENAPNGAAIMATASHHETAATGEKRKAEEEEEEKKPSATANGNGEAKPSEQDPEERPEKKVKLTDNIAEKVTEVKEKVEAKAAATKGKPGRPKKDKNLPTPVGRTERKTRSQGPAQ